MKNYLIKFYIVAIYLCSTVVLFAQDPGVDDGTTSFESGSSDNTGTAPIGDYIWVLALLAIVYAFWKIVSFLENKSDAKH